MQNEVGTIVENGVGIITLKREKTINALTPEMIKIISKSLEDWSRDPLVKMVLFEGAGARGFCAGGDVRWTREKVMAGEIERVWKFFEAEYKMNLMIATYDKPIIALTHGVVMGGGIGLAGHARYKITTKTARFAMLVLRCGGALNSCHKTPASGPDVYAFWFYGDGCRCDFARSR